MSRAVYEVRVRGSVPAELLEDFAAQLSDADADAGTTTIRADLADQSALHGLIHALRQEGLTLVDVRREPRRG